MSIQNKLYVVGRRVIINLISTPKRSISKFFVAESDIITLSTDYKYTLGDGIERGFSKFDMVNFDDLKMELIAEYPHDIVGLPVWYCAQLHNKVAIIMFSKFKPGDVIYYFEKTREFFVKNGAKLMNTTTLQYDKKDNHLTGFVLMSDADFKKFLKLSPNPANLDEIRDIPTLVYNDGKYTASTALYF